MTEQFRNLPLSRIVLISAILLSLFSTVLFVSNDFHNTHFDSKGHQLVPRRIVDNLSPGWVQIGAFWLPLPHVLYLPLVQSDYIYFHGLAGTPFSMISFIATVWLLFRLLEKIFGKISAFFGSVLYLTNPNILYLQSTSLTENMMIFFMTAVAYLLVRYVETRRISLLWWTSVACGLGNLVRYDNWFVFGLAGLLLVLIDVLEKRGIRAILRDGLILGSCGFAAVALSFWINWATTGHAIIDITDKYTDFQLGKDSYVLSMFVILYTLSQLVSYEWTIWGILGFIGVFRKKFRDPAFLAMMALLGPVILYAYGYHNNHPMRIRYGLPFVAPGLLFAAWWAGRSRLTAYLFAMYVVYMALSSPFHRTNSSQLLLESMRDAENIAIQRDLLWYLKQNDDGTLILAAMGEIAPVLYDLRLPIRRYVHEGAKPWWNDARKHPETVVGWVLISQDDKLWREFHDNPEFHRHFALIGRRSYLELYRRTPDEQHNILSHRPHSEQQKGEIRNLPL